MKNKHYDHRVWDIEGATEIVSFDVENGNVFVKIKKKGDTYHVTTKEETKGPEFLRFSTPSYQRAVVEYKMILKVALDELEEIASESQE